MVNGAVLALRPAERNHLLDNFRNGFRLGADSARAGNAPELEYSAVHDLRFFARKKLVLRMDKDERAVAVHNLPRARVVKGNDGKFFRVNIEPDIEFRPVGQRKNTDTLRLLDAGIQDVPELGALVFGIPLAMRITERVNAFIGARFFFVAASAAE